MKTISLNTHTHYSIKKGLTTIEELVGVVSDNPDSFIPAVCVTDNVSLGSFVKLSKLCKAKNLKPIFGAVLNVIDEYNKNIEHHITVLAKNEQGFKDLIFLNNRSWDSFYYVPRLSLNHLFDKSSNLIVLSGDIDSKLSTLVIQNKIEDAKKLIEDYKKKIPQYYIEIVCNDYKAYPYINASLIKLANETGTPYVCTSDSKYLKEEDSEAYKLWLLSGKQLTLKEWRDIDSYPFDCSKLHYFRHEDYIKYSRLPENDIKVGLEEAIDIALNKIENIEIDNCVKIPRFDNATKIFEKKVYAGFKRRELPEEYKAKLEYEISVIEKAKLEDYFLCVEDYVSYAKSIGSLIGERGSAASSLVNYCLGITNFDPIKAGLLFDRFLSEDRVQPVFKDGKIYLKDISDIDLDVGKRDEVMEYIVNKYGKDRTCYGGNYQKANIRSCILDVSRVYGIEPSETFPITKTIEQSDEESDELDDIDIYIKNNDSLNNYFKKYPDVEKGVRILYGRIKGMGRHASAMIVLDRDLDECLPYYTREGIKHSLWIEGLNDRELNDVGIAKFDLLGLKNLEVVASAVKKINRDHNKTYTVENIPLDDPKSYKLISECRTNFIFQLESGLAKQVCKTIQPKDFKEVVMISSIIRPGPYSLGMHNKIADIKNGVTPIVLPNKLKEILGETYAQICYQEQFQLVAQAVGGFDGIESNKLRKVLVKIKDPVERAKKIPEYKQRWDDNAWKNLLEDFDGDEEKSKAYSEDLWKTIESMAQYVFNRGHSWSYSLTTVREAYLKANYPVDFIATALSFEDTEKIPSLMTELKEYDIKLNYPDINKSTNEFEVVDNNNLLFPLTKIKNITDRVYESVQKTKGESIIGFHNFEDFMSRINRKIVDKRKIESLILSNCFQNTDGDRLELLQKFYNKYVEDGEQNEFTKMKESEIVKIEEDLMGFSLSKKSLYDQVKDYVRAYGSSVKFPVELKTNMDIRGDFLLVGTVKDIKEKTSKKGKQYWDVKITDNEADVYMFVWGSRDMKKLSKKGVYIFSVRTFKDSSRISLIETKDNIRVIM